MTTTNEVSVADAMASMEPAPATPNTQVRLRTLSEAERKIILVLTPEERTAALLQAGYSKVLGMAIHR